MGKKTKYQAFYTKSDPILNYMVGKLNLIDGVRVLEPCAGDGVFADKVLSVIPNVNLDLFELNPLAKEELSKKYQLLTRVRVKETDTLLDNDVLNKQIKYDRIIGNPPYGAKDDDDKKQLLKKYYPGLYVKESYSLFLYACVNLLSENGRLVFIIPDTFLFLHRHTAIRRYLLNNTQIEEIKLFPSSFFPGVNFGYSNLCIISLIRKSNSELCLNNRIRIVNNIELVEDLTELDKGTDFFIRQGDTMNNPDSAFQFCNNDRISSLINNPDIPKIGNIAACVTGFYSGDDKKYLHPDNEQLKNSKKYLVAPKNKRCSHILSVEEQLNGISSLDSFVPIVKGGNKKYYKPNEWYMDWSSNAISEYRQSKKCRFQNSDYYFKAGGIAIPMVRSSQLTAALTRGRLIDQSIVGVFPHDISLEKFLVAFFNTFICSKLISTINPSTNNSANYIKKIPIIIPKSSIIEQINEQVDIILNKLSNFDENIVDEEHIIESIFEGIYKI